MRHFTYTEQSLESNDLLQGDIIKRTTEIEEVLNDVHPHYLHKADYTHFLIISQTCDLVRRGERCATPYISLAAVRPLRTVLAKEFPPRNEFERKFGFAPEKTREKVKSFLSKLYNNNQKEYFFLYRQNDRGIDHNSCAFLRLSIALRASDHYDKLLEGRILGLTEQFRAKLGWAVGNIYGRVATDDFSERYKSSYRDEIDSYTESLFDYRSPQKLTKAAKSAEAANVTDQTAAADLVERQHVSTHADRALTALKNVARRRGVELDEDFLEQLSRTPDYKYLARHVGS